MNDKKKKWNLIDKGSGTYKNGIWVPFLGKFILVGSNGLVAVSPDGTGTGSWYIKEQVVKWNLYAIASSEEQKLIVAAGKPGCATYSKEGAIWNPIKGLNELQSTDKRHGESITALACNENGFFCSGDTVGNYYISKDGMTWTKKKSGSRSEISRLFPAPEGFIAAAAGGNVGIYDIDKDEWNWQRLSGENFYSCYYDPDTRIYLVGGKAGALYYRSDSKNWTPVDTSTCADGAYFYTITKSGDNFFSCGNADVGGYAFIASAQDKDVATWERYSKTDVPFGHTLTTAAANDKAVVLAGAHKTILQCSP